MSIVSDKALVPESNIIINIHVSRARLVHAEMMEVIDVITVEGEIIWVKHFPDAPSRMGIRFKESNEELIRIYKAKSKKSKIEMMI
jgi:hypothetical protein